MKRDFESQDYFLSDCYRRIDSESAVWHSFAPHLCLIHLLIRISLFIFALVHQVWLMGEVNFIFCSFQDVFKMLLFSTYKYRNSRSFFFYSLMLFVWVYNFFKAVCPIMTVK